MHGLLGQSHRAPVGVPVPGSTRGEGVIEVRLRIHLRIRCTVVLFVGDCPSSCSRCVIAALLNRVRSVAVVQGELSDYVVHDGVFGSKTKFNRFTGARGLLSPAQCKVRLSCLRVQLLLT